jgi:hypothetical protein
MIMAEIHESALLKYNFPLLYEVSQMHHNANQISMTDFLKQPTYTKARWCSSDFILLSRIRFVGLTVTDSNSS